MTPLPLHCVISSGLEPFHCSFNVTILPAAEWWWPCWSGDSPSLTSSRSRQAAICRSRSESYLYLIEEMSLGEDYIYIFIKCILHSSTILFLTQCQSWTCCWSHDGRDRGTRHQWTLTDSTKGAIGSQVNKLDLLQLFLCSSTSRGLNTPGEFFSML